MPRKHYAKKATKRKPYRKVHRKRPRRRALVSNYVPSGMPTTRIAKLKYCQINALTSTSGILTEQLYSANNIYDPDVSGAGHQPMGHDQWAALFNHYVVLGSKITLKCCDSDSTVAPTHVGLYLSDGKTLSYTSGYQYAEARKGQNRLTAPGANKTLYMRAKFSAKKFYNVKDMKDNTDRLGAAVGASPGEQAFFHFWVQTIDASTNTIRYIAEIEYIVLFSEPKDLSTS